MRKRKHRWVAVMILVVLEYAFQLISVRFGQFHIASPNEGDLGVVLGRERRGDAVE
jgi:hypothetical protein